MDNSANYRKPLIAFRVPDAPKLVSNSVHKSTLALTEVRGGANHGLTSSMAYDEAYLVQLRLLECQQCDYFVGGRHLDHVDHRAGVVQIHDLTRDPTVYLKDPFHVVHFYLPRPMLNAVAIETGASQLHDLLLDSGDCFQDPVINSLFAAVRPALANPEQATTLFVDHISAALSIHVARTYGGLRNILRGPRGGLAPRQERRVREMMEADLCGDFSLMQLAKECGISVRHFSRAFRQSFGMPPHRYQLKRRLEMARKLLLTPELTLHDIALACGFADQSHFTRVFGGWAGISPGGWRRAHLSVAESALALRVEASHK